MIHAYVTRKGVDRADLSRIRRHAVSNTSHLSGALDSECGLLVARYVGPWEPGAAENCPTCVRLLAKLGVAA